jgi:hypothetical protein
MTYLIIFLIVCSGIHFCAHAQPGAAEKNRKMKVDSFVATQIKEHQIAGMSFSPQRLRHGTLRNTEQ